MNNAYKCIKNEVKVCKENHFGHTPKYQNLESDVYKWNSMYKDSVSYSYYLKFSNKIYGHPPIDVCSACGSLSVKLNDPTLIFFRYFIGIGLNDQRSIYIFFVHLTKYIYTVTQ